MSGIIVWMGIPVGVWVWVFQKQYTAVTGVNNNKLKMECAGNHYSCQKLMGPRLHIPYGYESPETLFLLHYG